MTPRILAPLFLMLLISCGRSGPEHQNVFVYNESSGISSLDPAHANNLEDMWAVNQLYDGLVVLSDSLEVRPLIAQRWEVDASGTIYTFHLRQDVLFAGTQDFAPRAVTAADFVFSFQRIVDPAVASPGRWVFESVDLGREGGFKAENDSTLVIFLKEPFAGFPGILSTQYCNVVRPEAVEKYSRDFRFNPSGSGPFRFAFWEENTALVFHRNPDYFLSDENGNRLPYLEAVKIEFTRDMTTEYLGLLNGRYDFMSGIHPSFKDELLDAEGELREAYRERLRLQHTPFIKTDYLGILMDSETDLLRDHPLRDVRVRKALNLAIDKNRMVRFLRNNTVYPAHLGFVPRGLPIERSGIPSQYDPAEASRLLAEAGYPGGKGLPELTISATSDYTDLMEFVQHQWQSAGIRTKVEILPGPAHRELTSKARLLLFRKSWLADYADAENFLALFYSPNFCPSGPNYTRFRHPEYDRLYELSRSETDEHQRLILYGRMDSILLAEVPVIPLFYDRVTHFLSTSIHDFPTNPVNMLDLTRVRKGMIDVR
jgi:oligopeptide transport system substrate-binding protein